MRFTFLVLLLCCITIPAFSQGNFFEAVQLGKTDVVAKMLDNGFNVDSVDKDEFTAVHYAANDKNLAMLELLLKHEANPDIRDRVGMTALMWCAKMGNLDALKMLMAYGADWLLTYQQSVIGVTTQEKSLTQLAQEAGQGHIVEFLESSTFPVTGRVLITLVKNGEWDKYRDALSSNYPVNDKDCFGATALMYATGTQYYERWMKHLIDAGADPLAKDKWNRNLLHWVAIRGSYEAVDLCLEHKVDLEARDTDNLTPLLTAAWNSGLETITNLVEAGAKIDVYDNNGESPLSAVIMKKKDETAVEIAEFLIKKGAKVEFWDKEGLTPLCQAVVKHKMECVNLLLEKGANVSATGADGWTPVFQAVFLNDPEEASKYLEVLLKHKPTNLEALYQGKTALAIAKDQGKEDCVELLKDAGAKE